MIAIGAVAERGRLGPLLVFVFVWSTLVYGMSRYMRSISLMLMLPISRAFRISRLI